MKLDLKLVWKKERKNNELDHSLTHSLTWDSSGWRTLESQFMDQEVGISIEKMIIDKLAKQLD